MKTHVTFTTELFETETPKHSSSSFGEDCAHWLTERLRAQRFMIGNLLQEDWGWTLPVTVNRNRFYLNVELSEDDGKRWLIWCEPLSGVLTRLFDSSNADDQAQLCQAVDEILHQSTALRDVKWYAEQDWIKGKDEWTEAPN